MALLANGIDTDTIMEAVKRFLPDATTSEVAIDSPGAGPGFWNGSPSAYEHEGVVYLAYRTRQPIELGRGQGTVVAKSTDGVHFETIQVIDKNSMNAESLERPALVRTPEGRWRIYLSCATTGTKHWRVEMLEADTPDSFDPTTTQVVMPGDDQWAVKDPVIIYRDNQWHCWATFHPLDTPEHEDRMVSRYATSADGLSWQWVAGNCLEPRSGTWDERGARIAAIHFTDDAVIAYYDGRASAAENYEERTGVAVGKTPDTFVSFGEEPFAQSPDGKGLRYMDIMPKSDGSYRTYFEVAKSDGSHELRTALIA